MIPLCKGYTTTASLPKVRWYTVEKCCSLKWNLWSFSCCCLRGELETYSMRREGGKGEKNLIIWQGTSLERTMLLQYAMHIGFDLTRWKMWNALCFLFLKKQFCRCKCNEKLWRRAKRIRQGRHSLNAFLQTQGDE